ncbi:MAG: alanine--glyoxylate aminotransferase family protein, partial [Chloroflexi bacterium]|nr:alanine--glyoxylate aminotransferase family protein [Chloroflexota bacterium]
QKGWMVPPGLAMLGVSPRAWEANARARMPRAYFDLAAAKRFLQRGQTPWTPALSIVFALDVALDMLLQESLPAIHARHAWAGAMVRRAVREMGLRLFPAEERYASNTVTAVRVPPTVEARALRKLLREEYGVVLAGGQDKLAESIFRIGHLGHIPQADLTAALDALAKALPRVGFAPPVPTHRDAGER